MGDALPEGIGISVGPKGVTAERCGLGLEEGLTAVRHGHGGQLVKSVAAKGTSYEHMIITWAYEYGSGSGNEPGR